MGGFRDFNQRMETLRNVKKSIMHELLRLTQVLLLFAFCTLTLQVVI